MDLIKDKSEKITLDIVPNEIIQYLFSQLSIVDLYILLFVSKRIKCLSKIIINDHRFLYTINLVKEAAKMGYLDILKWFQKYTKVNLAAAINIACKYNHLHIIDWAYSSIWHLRGIYDNTSNRVYVSQSSEIKQYISPYNHDMLNAIIIYGNIDALKWFTQTIPDYELRTDLLPLQVKKINDEVSDWLYNKIKDTTFVSRHYEKIYIVKHKYFNRKSLMYFKNEVIELLTAFYENDVSKLNICMANAQQVNRDWNYLSLVTNDNFDAFKLFIDHDILSLSENIIQYFLKNKMGKIVDKLIDTYFDKNDIDQSSTARSYGIYNRYDVYRLNHNRKAFPMMSSYYVAAQFNCVSLFRLITITEHDVQNEKLMIAMITNGSLEVFHLFQYHWQLTHEQSIGTYEEICDIIKWVRTHKFNRKNARKEQYDWNLSLKDVIIKIKLHIAKHNDYIKST